MESLYLGPRYWPLTPPLQVFQPGGLQAGLILPPTEISAENLSLLQKILAAVRWDFAEVTIWQAHTPLSWGRLALLPYPYLWLFDKKLLSVPVGLYDTRTGQRLTQMPSQKTSLLWRLPTLSDMHSNQKAKQEAWQWLKLLTLKS